MPNLQVKNIPAPLHRKLQAQARRQGRTLRDLVLDAVRREVEREDFRIRLSARRPVELGRSAADSLGEVRGERDEDLSR
jgi:plasmid stability protein